jgi:hypothetical protein
LKFYAIATPVAIIVAVLMTIGIGSLVTSFMDDDKPDDTWSDFADKSNQYTDYTLEKYKGYSPGIYASATCARITYTSGDTFVVNVEKEPSYTKWYHLYADEKGIRIEYHVTDYSSAVSYVDKVPSIYYIPYESIMSVYVNNLPSEY